MAPRIKYDRVSYVDPHPGKEDSEILWDSACTRCGGSGEFREFDHIENGICFECRGETGYRFEYTVGMARKEAQRDVRRTNKMRLDVAKSEKFLADASEIRSEWKSLDKNSDILNPGWGADAYTFTANPNFNQFVLNLWNQIQGYGKFSPKPLSEKQIHAGADALKRYADRVALKAEREAAKAEVAPVVEGKQVISGTVYGTKYVDGIYGVTYKFGIRTESGQTYWGTIPKKLMALEILATGDWESKLNGTQVSLKADVSPSRDDHTHGFYKRPTLVSADLLNS